MANNYITADPITLDEFLSLARAQGFTVGRHAGAGLNIEHADGRGCYGISEEDHGEIYVGFMHDPEVDGVATYAEGEDGYYEITGEGGWEDEDEDKDDGDAEDEDEVRIIVTDIEGRPRT